MSNPSRLDPEPVARRDFLGLAAGWATFAALFTALAGALRLPKAAVLPSPSKKFRLLLPESTPPGEPFVPDGRPVAIFRDAAGVYALSTVCTHLGCIVKRSGGLLECPCHGSRFSPDGAVVSGPAPKGLPWLALESGPDGTLIVDEGNEVPAGTKVKTPSDRAAAAARSAKQGEKT